MPCLRTGEKPLVMDESGISPPTPVVVSAAPGGYKLFEPDPGQGERR
jgi:hypothetical protein